MAQIARDPQAAKGPKGIAGRGELAPYAASMLPSRGRLSPEPDCPMRSPFQRDRDRIIHSTAFRRLTHKTQVFVYHEGDHFRSRLTHSIEVAQIARSIARQLALDEDLAEALALAHDLGHPPFGHAGERALQRRAAAYGGFDHNAQSLRVVTALERKYAEFEGLNLAWETLEGLVKHNGPLTGPWAPAGHDLAGDIAAYNAHHDLALDRHASAEAQAAAVADDIAYNNHDLDDGLRAGLIKPEDLRDVALVGELMREVEARYGGLDGGRLIYEVNRRLITRMVNDVVVQSRIRLARLAPADADAIRAAAEPAVAFSAELTAGLAQLRGFLYAAVYRHPRVMEPMLRAEAQIEALFDRYLDEPSVLPDRWRAASAGLDRAARARLVVDFVAGMTDRYAETEHRRLFDAPPELR
ncbi:MAG: deoxyguanosinetriphosphate triphosphohydrolase [Hyphomicrobiaceae bacterium]